MGFNLTGDSYNRRGDEALNGVPHTAKVVDDIATGSEFFPMHYQEVRMILERCREHGITLNSEKFKFAEESVKFVGYHLSADGMSPGHEKVEAIANFPNPQSRMERRSFLG